jgi:hypothetical protein
MQLETEADMYTAAECGINAKALSASAETRQAHSLCNLHSSVKVQHSQSCVETSWLQRGALSLEVDALGVS